MGKKTTPEKKKSSNNNPKTEVIEEKKEFPAEIKEPEPQIDHTDINNWPIQMKTQELSDIVKNTFEKNGRIPFIIDRAGVLKTFYDYKGIKCEVGKFVVQNIMGGNNNIGEEMRKSYISAIKYDHS